MIVLGIIVGVILLIIALIGLNESVKQKNRKAKCKTWKVGDKIALCRGNRYYDVLERKKKEMAILKGWDLENLYIDCGDDMIYQVDWSVMSFNKSAIWRENYENAKKVMGCDPGFSGGVGESSTTVNRIYGGKPIDTMNEVECEVFLKKALEEEDYETADLIRQRMEKFR